MEPRGEENQKAPQPGAEPKRRRFRIVKLEERIAPGQGGNRTNNTCTQHSNLAHSRCGSTVY